MEQHVHELTVATRGKGLYEVTGEVGHWVAETGLLNGLLTVFCRHTSASLLLQENADPSVRHDLAGLFGRLVADGDPHFTHRQEGRDDMSAHARTALTQTSLSVPLVRGALALGTWQGVFLFEHRLEAQSRRLVLHLLGSRAG